MPIGDALVEVIPSLAVAIDSTVTISKEVEVLATQMPGRCLVLEADRHRVRQPVRDVGIPEHSSAELDSDVLQACRVHDGANVVSGVVKDDMSIFLAVLESLQDRWSIVALGIATCWHVARLASLWPRLVVRVRRSFLHLRGEPATIQAKTFTDKWIVSVGVAFVVAVGDESNLGLDGPDCCRMGLIQSLRRSELFASQFMSLATTDERQAWGDNGA